MTATLMSSYREALEGAQTELAAAIAVRDGAKIEQRADPFDVVQLAGERELAIRSIDRKTQLLREIRNALRRLEDGTFGRCVSCEENVSATRLQALPWAALCLTCQQQADTQVMRANSDEGVDL